MNPKEAPTDILALALAFYQEPLCYQELLQARAELPEGVKLLLRVAGGKTQLMGQVDGARGVSSGKLREAAIFFIEQVFFPQDASYYRVLGLNPDATNDQIKEHHRLLMRLFHPDRNDTREAWTDIYASRVNQAYTVLHRPKLRRSYDASRRATPPKAQQAPSPVSRRRRIPEAGSAVRGQSLLVVRLPSVLLRYLPQIVLGGIAVLAILFVIVIYLSQRQVTIPVMVEQDGILEAPRSIAAGDQENTIKTSSTPSTPTAIHDEQPADSRGLRFAQADESRHVPPSDTEQVRSIPVTQEKPITHKAVVAQGAVPTELAAPAREKEAEPKVAIPTAAKALAPPVEVAQHPISVLELTTLIERFTNAYEQGNLEGFLGLFAEQAHADSKGGKAAIGREYGKLFYTTQSRHMSLSNLHWQREPRFAHGKGRFLVGTQGRGKRAFKRYSGTIHFEVEKRNGELLIRGLYHIIDKHPITAPVWEGHWNWNNR